MNLRLGAQSGWRFYGSPAPTHRQWFTCAAIMIVLSLAVVSPLACIFHCLTFAPIGTATQYSSTTRAQLICLLHPHSSSAGDQSAPPPAPVPAALYQLALPLNQRPLVIVALTLMLRTITYRIVAQLVTAPPTPPPRATSVAPTA